MNEYSYIFFDESGDDRVTDHCRNCKHHHPVYSWVDVNKCLDCGCTNYETSDNLAYLEKKYNKTINKS